MPLASHVAVSVSVRASFFELDAVMTGISHLAREGDLSQANYSEVLHRRAGNMTQRLRSSAGSADVSTSIQHHKKATCTRDRLDSFHTLLRDRLDCGLPPHFLSFGT